MAIQLSKDIIHPYAKNFIEKAGGYQKFTNTEILAVNFLVKRLIDANLWNKFKALYPFIGRNAQAHSLNLVNLNRHNIRWYGNVTHNRFGITGNGGYGNTLCSLGWFTNDNIHLAVYNATSWSNANASSNLMGVTTKGQKITLRTDIGRYTYSLFDEYFFSGQLANDILNIEAFGLIVGSNSTNCYVNGEPFGAASPNDPITFPGGAPFTPEQDAKNNSLINPLDQYPILLLSYDNFGSVTTKSSTNIRFASIGYGLTSNEHKIFYDIIEKFQTLLSRNVGSIKVKTTEFKELEKENITANFTITNVMQASGIKNFNFVENEFVVPILSITRASLAGARRIYLEDKISSNVSLISFTEI